MPGLTAHQYMRFDTGKTLPVYAKCDLLLLSGMNFAVSGAVVCFRDSTLTCGMTLLGDTMGVLVN